MASTGEAWKLPTLVIVEKNISDRLVMSALAEGDAELVWMTHIGLADKNVYILIVSSMESECQRGDESGVSRRGRSLEGRALSSLLANGGKHTVPCTPSCSSRGRR